MNQKIIKNIVNHQSKVKHSSQYQSPTSLFSSNVQRKNPQSILNNSPKHNSIQMKIESQHINTVFKENTILRQQNKALKKQLNLQKINNEKSYKNSPVQISNFRETIKKQNGVNCQLKTRIEVLSKQCRMYEDIIEKMQQKIYKMNQNKKKLQQKIGEISVKQIDEKKKFNFERKNQHYKSNFTDLRNKIHETIINYTQLETIVIRSEQEWQQMKQQWQMQKSYYINRINELQHLLGFTKHYKSS